jgi:hypothetical protein
MKSKLIFLLCLLVLSACQAQPAAPGTPTPQPASTQTIPAETTLTTSEVNPETQNTPDPTNPLTGLPVADPSILNRRPVMIKVSNFPREGRPHAGLAFADLVFNYYIGEGTDRFLALFYGQNAERVGPVRSGRLVDVHLVSLYQGILGFGSADYDTREVIFGALGRRAIANLEAPCPAFCGSDTHSVIGVFANSAALSDWYSQNAGDNQRFNLSGMTFNETPPSGGKSGSQLMVLFNYYNRGEWRYDSASNKYLRWYEEMLDEASFQMVPSLERITGQQLAFDNVIILFVQYVELAPSKHEIEVLQNLGGQRALFFRNGQLFEGTWKVGNQDKPIQFFNAQGNPFPLKPGNSWVFLMGLNSSFEEKSPGQWESFFLLP